MHIESNIPPPERIAGAVDTDKYVSAFRRRERKPLLVRTFEPLPGRYVVEARDTEEGPRVNSADLGFPPFMTASDAMSFSMDVCCEFWRKHG